MKRILIICILIVSIIFISGCTSDEQEISDSDTNSFNQQNTPNVDATQSQKPLQKEEIIKTEWFPVEEGMKRFELANGVIIVIEFLPYKPGFSLEGLSFRYYFDKESIVPSSTTYYISLILKDKNGNENNMFSRYNWVSITPTGSLLPDDAAFWKVELKAIENPTPTPTPTTIKID